MHTRPTLTAFPVALLFALTLLGGCAQVPRQGVTSPGTGAMAYALDGPDRVPVVVLQSGLGEGRSTWSTIWSHLIANHRVFALDRPGYGESPASPTVRDPCQVARELRAALQDAKVPPPYLLVGHSIGGLYQYAFARLFPQDTAGLLLLDPTHPDHWATLQRETPKTAATLRGLRATIFTPTMRAEFDAQSGCLDSLPPPMAQPIPTRMLVSTRFGPLEGEEYQRAVRTLRLDWQRRLGAPSIEAIAGSGHYLHRDAPERVVRAIEDMTVTLAPARR